MEGLLSVRNPFPNWNHLSLFLPLAIDWNFCRLLLGSKYSLEQCRGVSGSLSKEALILQRRQLGGLKS